MVVVMAPADYPVGPRGTPGCLPDRRPRRGDLLRRQLDLWRRGRGGRRGRRCRVHTVAAATSMAIVRWRRCAKTAAAARQVGALAGRPKAEGGHDLPIVLPAPKSLSAFDVVPATAVVAELLLRRAGSRRREAVHVDLLVAWKTTARRHGRQ